MYHNKQIVIRLPEDLMKHLDRYAEKLTKASGEPVSRAEAVRRILGTVLRAERKARAL